jgi:tripartite-type tricarboxylate transporter receptor subunit TctC
VKELIDYAKKNPGKLTNASSSNGSPGHVGGELFKWMTGTDIVHVPYRGGAPAITDLIAGHVDLMFESLQSIAPFARDDKVRALGVSGAARSPAFPELPTIAEAGVPGYLAPTWTGAIAPAGVPRPIVDKLNAAINKALTSEAFKEKLPRSAMNRPAERRKSLRQRSRRIPPSGPTLCTAPAQNSTESGSCHDLSEYCRRNERPGRNHPAQPPAGLECA